MTIFIPENLIYFYVFGSVDGLLDAVYGSIDIISNYNCLAINADAYDVLYFTDHKIMWGRMWKYIYFKYYSPFRINLVLNDRFNWAYPHTMYQLLSDMNSSIFLTQFASIKGFIESPHKFVFNYNTFVTEPLIYDIYQFKSINDISSYINYIYTHNICIDSFDFSSSFAHASNYDQIGVIIFLLVKNYNYIFFESYNTIIAYILYYIQNLCISSLGVSLYFFIFTLSICMLICIYINEAVYFQNAEEYKILKVFDETDKIFFRYINGAVEYDTKNKFSFYVFFIGYLLSRNFNIVDSYTKISISLIYLKKLIFKFRIKLNIFILMCVLKHVYSIFMFFFTIPFLLFEFFFWNVKTLLFPFRSIVYKHVNQYSVIFFRNLNYWFFIIIIFIVNDLRNDTFKGAILGWIKWTQVSSSWDEFVENEWIKFELINLEKKIAKYQKQKDEAEDNKQRLKLRRQKLSDEDIESIIKAKQAVREKNREIIKPRVDLRTSFKQYKVKHHIDEDVKKKEKSFLWLKLYNKYIRPMVSYETKALTKEELTYEKPITEDFIKEMSYYNWLMERKYLLFTHSYNYFDYKDFMEIQQDMLKYYYETALILKVIKNFTNFFSYSYNSDKSYERYMDMEHDVFISMGSRINLDLFRFTRFYIYFISKEGKFISKFLLCISQIHNIFNLFFITFYYMFSYLWFIKFYFLTFFKFIWNCNIVTIKYYAMIFKYKLPKKYLWIYSFFYIISVFFKFIYTNILLSIKFVWKLFILVIDFIANIYLKLSWSIRVKFFDLWYFFFFYWFNFIDKFKRIVIFFVLLFFSVGLTPFDVFGSLFSFISLFIFDFIGQFTIYFDFITLRSHIIFFFVSNMHEKWLVIMQPFLSLETWYLKNMFDINIYVYFTPIFTYVGYILVFPVFLAVNYTPYINFVTTWNFYDFYNLETLNFLIKQEISREMSWRSNNFFKTLFGGFLYHPIYRLIKDQNGEIMILIKYFWYDFFTLHHRLQISEFLIHLPGYISVYPYWVIRYGAYYVLWRYNEQDVGSKFLNVSVNYTIFLFYVRWHIIGYITTIINLIILYPSKSFFYPIDLLLNFLNNYYLFNLLNYYLNFFLLNVEKSLFWFYVYRLFDLLLNYTIIFSLIMTEYLFKGLFYFFYITMSGLKIFGHFFQCFIPFLRYVIKYDTFIFLIFIDTLRSIFNIMLIFYYIFEYIIYILWGYFKFFVNFYSNWFLGILIGNIAEFFYKFILYPYFVVYLDGFFDYYGKYGLWYGSGVSSLFNVIEFVDITDHMHIKRDYTSLHKRWSLAFIDGYNNIDYSFVFRNVSSYREIGSATAFYHIYVWVCYVIYLFILCTFSVFLNKYIKNKDNVTPDSTYMWYRFSSGNRILKLSKYELMWLTQNKWLFSFKGIKGIINKNTDMFDGMKENSNELGVLMSKHIDRAVTYGKYDNTFLDYLRYIVAYGTNDYNDIIFGKENKKYENYVRFDIIQKKVDSLFKARIYNTAFARQLFNTIQFNPSKKARVIHFRKVAKIDDFYKYWVSFVMPLMLNNKYSYTILRFFDNRKKYKNYFKALKLFLMHKENDKFKDLHDFYFLEHDFYENLVSNWLWGKSKTGALLRAVVTSRETNKMVYSSKYRTSLRLFDKNYLNYMDNYIGNLIKLSDVDDNWFGGLLNFRMHNIFTSNRVVSTQLTAKEIEQKVLEEYTDFMEVGWEQDREEDGIFGVYKYLSERLYDSFLDNEDIPTEYTKFLGYGIDMNKKLALSNFYAPLADPWLGLSIILPLIVSLYLYKIFIFFSISFPMNHPWFHYEFSFFLIYLLYYIHPHFFYVTIASKLMFFPKLYRKRRKLRSFATSRLLSIVEKFFPNDELLRLLINFSAYVAVFNFIWPTYDFLIFYLIFVICILIFYKLIYDFDIL